MIKTMKIKSNNSQSISQKSRISGNLEMSEKQSFSEHSQKSSIFDDSKNFQSKNKNATNNKKYNKTTIPIIKNLIKIIIKNHC